MTKITPLGNRLLISPLKEDLKTSSGIILTKVDKERSKGVVSAVGSECTKVKVGDSILFSPLHYEEIDADNWIIEEEDVWAIVKNESNRVNC